jgi:hypothetical protein
VTWPAVYLAAGGLVDFGGDVSIVNVSPGVLDITGATLVRTPGASWLLDDGQSIVWGSGGVSLVGADAGDFIGVSSVNTFQITWNDDTASGMNWTSYKNSASPAAGDYIAGFNFNGNDSAANITAYCLLYGKILDPTNGSEDGGFEFYAAVGGALTELLRVHGGSVIPAANDGMALGGASNRFSDLYLASGGVIDFNNDATITHSANTLAFAGATSGYTFDDSIIGASSVVVADDSGHLGLRSYTVGTLPSAATAARMIYVSDGTSNKRLAVSDGTNWRFPDGAVVS